MTWEEGALPDDLAALLDGVFLDSVPGRGASSNGWTWWTNVRRVASS